MPRNVRNFWIEIDVDGKRKRLACGPTAKDGGFVLTIYQRSKGRVSTGARVQGSVHGDHLQLRVEVPHDTIAFNNTER